MVECNAEDARALAGEFDCPVLSATTGRRGSKFTERMTADDVADSYAPLMICEAMVTLSQNRDEKESNPERCRLTIEANRLGKDRVTMPYVIYRDRSTLRVDETRQESDE